jgi:PncC family amidohydrolase
VITYADETKTSILGVSAQTIDSFGSVSEEVVLEMVSGVNRVFNSDFSVAVTGIAGPSGGTDLKPVGTVWFAMQRRGKEPISWKIERKGTRTMIINRSMNQLLSKLYHYAKHEA